MLKRIILAFLVIHFASLAKAQDAGLRSLGEFIYTVHIKKQHTLIDSRVNWWNEYLEWDTNDSLLQSLVDRIDSGKIIVKTPHYPFDKSMTMQEVQDILRPVQTTEAFDADGNQIFETSRLQHFEAENIAAISFQEEWFYNENTYEFKKVVKGFILSLEKTDFLSGLFLGYTPLFYVPMQQDAEGKNLNSKLADKRSVTNITYDLDLKDSSVSKQSEEAERNGLNGLLKTINKNISASSNVSLYDTLFPYCNPISITSPEYALRIKGLGSANNIRFMEDWSFDLNQLRFEKNVKGIILTEEKKTAENKIDRKRIAFMSMNKFIPTNLFAEKTILNVDHIRYTNQFNYYDRYQYELPPNKLVDVKNRTLGILLSQQAKEHKFKIYDTNLSDPKRNILVPFSIKDADQIFTWMDTAIEQIQDYNTGEFMEVRVAKTHELDYFGISGYDFNESWEFDPVKMTFEKKIKTIGVLFSIDDINSGERKGYRTLFSVVPTPVVDKQQLLITEYSIGKNIVTSVRIDENEATDNYDAYTNIYSFAESEKNDIPNSKRYPFVNGILNDVMKGTIVAYDTTMGSQIVLTPQQVTARIESMKGNMIPNGDIKGLYSMVNGIEFTEDWYFDLSNDRFYRKVKAISLVKMVMNNDEGSVNYRQWSNKKIFSLHLN